MRDLKKALELIKEFEGFESKPYKDSAGIPTIGIGTIKYPDGRKVSMSDPAITLETAMSYLQSYIIGDCLKLDSFIDSNKIQLNNNQYCALVCFSYNVGIGAIITKGRSVCEALKSGNHSQVVEGMKLFSKATVNGKRVTLNGLVRRRRAEVALYLS